MKLNQKGFTIPELLSVLILVAFFTTLILYFGFSYWRYGSLLESDLSTFVTRLDANDYLHERLGTSSGLIIQNGMADSHTLNPDPAIPSNLYWVPVHAIPKNTVATGSSTTPLLYFKRYSIAANGAYIMNGTQPYEDEYVLYINRVNKQLLVRTLANPNAGSNALKTSCPPANASSACPEDKIIASDLSSIDTKYFSRSGNSIDYTSSTDPTTGQFNGPDFPAVEVMELTLHVAKKPFLQKTNAIINDTVIRISLRNI